jgi:nucleosome binding factor SPN SPT16 subunit
VSGTFGQFRIEADYPSSCDVPLSEGPVNLSWPAIMKTVNEDPHTFYEDGGWEFLTGGDDVSYQHPSVEAC